MDGLNNLGVQIDPREQALRKVYDEARRLGLLSQPGELRMFQSLFREFDNDLFVTLRERVERAQRLDFLCPRPLDKYLPLPDEVLGEVRLGSILGTNRPYCISLNERHIATFAPTGEGKSVVCRLVQVAALSRGMRLVVFSKKRGDAYSVARRCPDKVVVFRFADQNFQYNPLEGLR